MKAKTRKGETIPERWAKMLKRWRKGGRGEVIPLARRAPAAPLECAVIDDDEVARMIARGDLVRLAPLAPRRRRRAA